jgi:hypothetical protein
MEHRNARRILIGLDGFAGVAGLIGMAIVAFGWGYRFPTRWLDGTPFGSYLIPGLILGVGVGGSALAAMVATIRSVRIGALASAAAGVIMVGWIVGEYLLIPEIRFVANGAKNWQQGLYFGVGVAMVALAVRIMPGGWRGVLPWRSHRPLDARQAIGHR